VSTAWRLTRAFGQFWWDFLVGDTPELFLAVLVLVALAFALHAHRWLAVVLLPALTIAALVGSTWAGRRRARDKPPSEHS
jgi:hypothetical protein